MSGPFSEKKRSNPAESTHILLLKKGAGVDFKGRLAGLKRVRVFTLILITVFLLLTPFCVTYAAKEDPEKEEKKEAKPVVITSGKLFADNIKHTALFEGNVIAKTEDMTIYSDRMMVYYTEDGGKMDRIEAYGNVKVVKGEQTIVSREAIYYEEEEKVVFTGDPQAWEGDNKVTGTVMTYFMKDERSIVENSKVVIINKKGKGAKTTNPKSDPELDSGLNPK